MKHFFCVAFVVILACSVFAQQSDPLAKKSLDKVSATFKSLKTISANFVYVVSNAAGKTISTQKGIVYMKGEKYHITLGNNDIFCNGSTVWNVDKNYKEVNVTDVEKSSKSLTPQKLFTNFYDKDFLYKSNGVKKVGNVSTEEIELTPFDKTLPFFKVYVYINKSTNLIQQIKLYEKSGNRYSYTLTTTKKNTALAEDLFTFDKSKFPNFEVVDMR